MLDDSTPPGKTESRRTPSQPGGLTLGPGAQITVGQGDVVAGDKIVNVLSKEDARTRRDHLILLNKVREFWVRGVLEKSVHSEAVIELGKEVAAEAIDQPRPWDMTLEVPDQSSQPITPNKKIIELFGEMEHALLILGAPGSGKTITLLELARDLIARAESDPAQPIPVVFNLSAWAERRQPLAEWMMDELSLKYQIPRKIGRKWLADNDILPLLDGLDEVWAEHRSDCVEAINAFYGEHSLAGIAVCSRHEEYGLLKAKLKLGGAILIQTLNDEQVTDYLASFGTKLAGLYKALRLDTTLKELAASPLMLGVMSLAYADVSLEEVLHGNLDSIEARRKHLFDAYVERMFKRKGADKRYTREQTMKWLAWLAKGMKVHGQTTFLIEELQPSWLDNRWWQWVYVIGSRVVAGIAVAVFFAILVNSFWLQTSFPFARTLSSVFVGALTTGMFGGLILGVADGFWLARKPRMKRTVQWQGLLYFLVLGCNGLLALTLIGGIIFWLRGIKRSLGSDIQTVESLNWSWRKALKVGGKVFGGGVIVGLIAGFALFFLYRDAVFAGLLIGPVYGLIFGVLVGLFGGLSSRNIDLKVAPNQGMRLTFKNALVVGTIFGVLITLVISIIVSLFFDFVDALIFGLISGIVIGLIATLWFGNLDVFQHYTLRLILALNKYLPLNLTRFLDYCADRVFLQKVGGGYIFIHRLLLEYFAEREPLKH